MRSPGASALKSPLGPAAFRKKEAYMTRRVAIIGGGAIGSAVAYWLTRDRKAGLEVTVLERDPAYREASSALSASSIRQQFSTPVNIAIGCFGIAFLRRYAEHLAVEGEVPDLGLVEGGYLFLASEAGASVLRANHEVQRANGADVALLGPDALRAKFPWIATEGVALASLGMSGEGWFDGYGLLRALRAKAIAQGARYLDAEAVGAGLENGTVREIRLGSGRTVPCDVAIVAAGPWSARAARFFGVDLPVRARRRTVFVIDTPEPPEPCPLVIDSSGVWFRPEGRQFICGTSPGAGEPDPDDLPLEPEHELFEARIWPALATRAPAFERLKVRSAWAGYYEVNTLDHNGIVGPHPALRGLYVATGFSGHGIQQAPAVGRAIAEHIIEGGYRSLDLSPLGPERVLEGRPLAERNVI
jgi:FAD-dependent oxidoreductase domain-containing protein 1